MNGVGIGAYGGGVHELGIALDTPDSDIKTTNLWLEVLAELGVIGFASLVALLVIAVVRPVAATPAGATRTVRHHSNRGFRSDVRVRADVVGAVPLDRLDPRLQHRVPAHHQSFALTRRPSTRRRARHRGSAHCPSLIELCRIVPEAPGTARHPARRPLARRGRHSRSPWPGACRSGGRTAAPPSRTARGWSCRFSTR